MGRYNSNSVRGEINEGLEEVHDERVRGRAEREALMNMPEEPLTAEQEVSRAEFQARVEAILEKGHWLIREGHEREDAEEIVRMQDASYALRAGKMFVA